MTASSHHVHGLAADDVAPDWPPLATAELARLLDRYPATGAPRALAWHSPRPLSAAALVDTAGGRLFVKRHHASVRSAAELAEEHAFMAHLRARGVPIPAVLTAADGASAVALGEWVYEVHAPAAGTDFYRDTMSWVPPTEPAHAWQAGAMLARLHAAAEGYAAAQRRASLLVARSELIEAADPSALLAARLSSRSELAAFLEARDWRGELAEALALGHAGAQARIAREPRLWTHGDWHVSNLCWSSAEPAAQVASVLDFGLAARTFALFDLATAIERNAIAWLRADDDRACPAIARALIGGYRSVRALDRDALDLLADLLPIVHVDFALSEVDYFVAITRSRANAEVAWNAFLRGHAAWFRTSPGQALLDLIRTGG
jgi:Ser/Thr protein kinase RdoA (MazF antagonist)